MFIGYGFQFERKNSVYFEDIPKQTQLFFFLHLVMYGLNWDKTVIGASLPAKMVQRSYCRWFNARYQSDRRRFNEKISINL